MNIELAILGAAALVTISAAVQHYKTFLTGGLAVIFTDRSTATSVDGFAGRAERTLRNNIESSAMFVPPATLLLILGGGGEGLPALAAAVYLVARVGYTFSYWLAANRLRSVLWGIGMAMIAITITAAALRVTAGGFVSSAP